MTKNLSATVDIKSSNSFWVTFEKSSLNYLTVHTTQPIPFKGLLNQVDSEVNFNPKVVAIYNLPGIEGISSHERYSMKLVKGSLFSWDQIIPDILPKLEDLMGMKLAGVLESNSE